MTYSRLSFLSSVAAFLLACADPSKDDGFLRVTVKLVDEQGNSVTSGQVVGSTVEGRNNDDGTFALVLEGPDALVASADGYLPEPLIVGQSDQNSTVQVRLLSRRDGRRRSMHFGGDVMFGRRYSAPTTGEPLLLPGEVAKSAKRIVEPISRVFSAADYSVVNLETVVSNLPIEEAYPGKRFLLNSPPEALSGLSALGVDLVSLANNHTRDWLETGLSETLEELDARGIAHVGAGLDVTRATAAIESSVSGLRVSTLSYTSVNGSFVNDNYPGSQESPPNNLADEDAWIWESREFYFSAKGLEIPKNSYRIGEVWQLYSVVESDLSEADSAAAWQSMTEVYPELQDWVARRGHGGAANYVSTRVKAQIADTKADSDLLVVQLHAGYQFQNVASESLTKMAHDCIDAGADLVVAHHPHVLQGVEFYRGKLIAHSLGNFVFDQDFLSTFSTGFLRTVWDQNTLLEARFVPVEIANYRPHIAADRASERVFSRLWESSVTPARSLRVGDGVYPIETDEIDPLERVGLEHQWGTVKFNQGLEPTTETLTVEGTLLSLPRHRLWRVNAGDGFAVGRELLGWGHFEDVLADGKTAYGQNFVFDHADKLLIQNLSDQNRASIRLHRDSKKKDTLWLRPVARVALPRHRLYRTIGESAVPVDPEPQYSIVAKVRGRGDVLGRFRVDTFHFDDTNPTEDPSSLALEPQFVEVKDVSKDFRTVEFPIELPKNSAGVYANMVMIYVGLAPPKSGESTFDVDDLEWVEWRDAKNLPKVFGAFDYVKALGTSKQVVIESVTDGGN
jgi:poly-gamma-glutamate capsule biosynthesis protein CapA/YwtB (metallophosphatase superfamily)